MDINHELNLAKLYLIVMEHTSEERFRPIDAVFLISIADILEADPITPEELSEYISNDKKSDGLEALKRIFEAAKNNKERLIKILISTRKIRNSFKEKINEEIKVIKEELGDKN